VPDRWEDYSNIGTLVEGTSFLAFKVPLKAALLAQVSQKEKRSWGVSDLLTSCPSIALVIDLTNTYRYYSPKELESKGVKHVKILTEGKVVPSEGVVQQFYRAVKGTEDGQIGVHCTHGLNRTGYLVCRYMIEILGWDPDKAIEAFDLSRGHKQERANYLQSLRAKGWERRKRRSGSGQGPHVGEDGKASALDRASKFMRDESTNGCEEPSTPLEQVEVERAWLVDKNTTADIESDAAKGFVKKRDEERIGEVNPSWEGSSRAFRERRSSERTLSNGTERSGRSTERKHNDSTWQPSIHKRDEHKHNNVRGPQSCSSWQNEREPWREEDHQRRSRSFDVQGRGFKDGRSSWGHDGYEQNWGRSHDRNGERRVHGSFNNRQNHWYRNEAGHRSSNPWTGDSRGYQSAGSNYESGQHWGQGQGWNSGYEEGVDHGRGDAPGGGWEGKRSRDDYWGYQGGSWEHQRNRHRSWPRPESKEQGSWSEGRRGLMDPRGSKSGSSNWDGGDQQSWSRGSGRSSSRWDDYDGQQQQKAFLDRQAHLERSALVVERQSHQSGRSSHQNERQHHSFDRQSSNSQERQDRPRQRKKFIQTPGGAFA